MKQKQNWLLNTSVCIEVSRVTRKEAEQERVYFILLRETPSLGLNHSPKHVVAGAISPLVKLPKREAKHSPSYITKVKNNCKYDSAASYSFTSYTRDNLAFVFLSMVHYWSKICALFSILLFSFKTPTFRKVVLPFLSD